MLFPRSYQNSEQVRSIVFGLVFSFPEEFAQGLLDRAREMPVVLIFDICKVYEIVAYDWLRSGKDGRYGSEISP